MLFLQLVLLAVLLAGGDSEDGETSGPALWVHACVMCVHMPLTSVCARVWACVCVCLCLCTGVWVYMRVCLCAKLGLRWPEVLGLTPWGPGASAPLN